MQTPSISYKRHRFPPSIISRAVWLYGRIIGSLSASGTSSTCSPRGVRVSYETMRDWVARFGGQFAGRIRCERPGPEDKWHLDEVVISIKGKKHWLWRAVDANGEVLDILLQSRRNTSVAKYFFRKLFRRWGYPRMVSLARLGVPERSDIASAALVNRSDAEDRERSRWSASASVRRG